MSDLNSNYLVNKYFCYQTFIYKFYLLLVFISLAFLIFSNINLLTSISYFITDEKGLLIIDILWPVCMLVHLINDKKKFVLCAVWLAICFTIYKLSVHKNPFFLHLATISIAFSLCRPSYIIRSAFILLALSIAVCFSFYFFELLKVEKFSFRDGALRTAFGFGHPNGLGSFVLALGLYFACYSTKKLNYLLSVIYFFIAAAFLIIFVNSKTNESLSLFSAVIFSVLFLINNLKNEIQKNKLLKIYSIVCISAFTLFSLGYIFLAYVYEPGNGILDKLNHLLTGRLGLSHNGLVNIGVSLFGKAVTLFDPNPSDFESVKAASYQYLDSLYINIPVTQGIFLLLLLNIMNIFVVRNSFKYNYKNIGASLFILSIYSISEEFFRFISFNVFIYLIFAKFNEKEILSKEELSHNLDRFIDTSKKLLSKTYFICKPIVILSSVIKNLFTCNIIKEIIELNCNKVNISKIRTVAYIYLLIFISVITVVLSIYFSSIIDYLKTFLSINEIINIKVYSLTVIASLLLCFLFIKSLYEVSLQVILKKILNYKSQKVKKSVIVYCLIFVLVISTFLVFIQIQFNKEIQKRDSDFVLLSRITDSLDSKSYKYQIYVDKEPVLYSKKGFNIQEKILSFDTIALEKSPLLIITKPNDLHYFVLKHGYKFSKISDSMALYVKDETIIEELNKLNIKLSDNYYFKKEVSLNRVAKLSLLKHKKGKPVTVKPHNNVVLESVPYLPKGKYNLTVTLSSDNNLQDNLTVGRIYSEASLGAILLNSKEIKSEDFTDNRLTCTVPISVDIGYSNVNVKLFVYQDIKLNIESVTFEKETSD